MKRSLSLRVQILIHRKRFFLHFRCKYLAAEGFQGARKLTKRIRTDQRGESISELRDYIGRGANTRIGKSAANGKSLKYTHTQRHSFRGGTIKRNGATIKTSIKIKCTKCKY